MADVEAHDMRQGDGVDLASADEALEAALVDFPEVVVETSPHEAAGLLEEARKGMVKGLFLHKSSGVMVYGCEGMAYGFRQKRLRS